MKIIEILLILICFNLLYWGICLMIENLEEKTKKEFKELNEKLSIENDSMKFKVKTQDGQVFWIYIKPEKINPLADSLP